MDSYHGGTACRSDFPGEKFFFETNRSKQEGKPVKIRYSEPEDRHIVLILLYPSQNDRLQCAAINPFRIFGKELGVRPAIVEKPVRFCRVSSVKHK
jgi:hypothetical protein